jgi:hypothetical protein
MKYEIKVSVEDALLKLKHKKGIHIVFMKGKAKRLIGRKILVSAAYSIFLQHD